MQIKSLQLNNFKCFENRLFNFTSRIEITGRNGSGKSTIAEAIVFALYNRTLNGSKDTDTYIMKEKDMCEATLTIDKGIIRRKRGKQSKVWFNDMEITQENLEKELNLPDFEIFNSIFNTGYFMTLDELMQRQSILDLTEKVDMVKLFKKLGGTDDQMDKWHINFDDLDSSYKEINKQKLICQKNIDSIGIEMDIYIKELSQIKIEDIKQLEDKKIKVQNLIKQNIQKVEELRKYKADLQRYKDILPLIESKKRLEEWLVANEIKECPKISKLQEKQKELYKQIVDLPKGLSCPVCCQKISVKHKKEIESNNKNIEKSLGELDKEIAEAVEIDKYNQNVFTEQNRLNSVVIPNLTNPINPKISEDIEGKISDLQNDLQIIEKQIGEINYNISRKQEIESKINERKKSISELEKSLIELKKLTEILSPKGLSNEEMNIKLKPLKDRLQKDVKGIDIHLLELLKSEMGYRKVFKISVNGIEYKRLSCGEKKRIDVSLSLILNDMLKERFNNAINMFFVDGMEALSQTINFSNNLVQIFLSEVSEEELNIKTL